jgi:hypothetical protein
MAVDRNTRGGELRPETRRDPRVRNWRLEVDELAANNIGGTIPHLWCGIYWSGAERPQKYTRNYSFKHRRAAEQTFQTNICHDIGFL